MTLPPATAPTIGCTLRVGGVRAEVRCSTRADGDFHVEQDLAALRGRRRAFVDLPWSQPDEVHGTEVLEVRHAGEHDLAVADALVTDVDDAVLGIWVGDCAPVGLVAASGRIGGVHAGWKGLEAGVIEATVDALRAGRDDDVVAVLGPCIHPCCYEFGTGDLSRLVGRYGPALAGRTTGGEPALDMPAAVAAALAARGVATVHRLGGCTGCGGDRWFSHRVRGERGRQVLAIWKPSTR